MASSPELISARAVQRIIGVLAIIFPPMLVIGGLLDGKGILQPSLSEYYYTYMSPFFVGTLFAIGMMFFAYKGYATNHGPIPLSDNMLANIAGVSSIGVAVVPSGSCPFTSNPLLSNLHTGLAGVMLFAMACFCLFYFTQSSPQHLSRNKSKRNMIYRGCGATIFICLFFCLLHILTREASCVYPVRSTPILWLEWIMIWAFGLAWLVKSEIILQD